jgi:2-phosphosulfolactate phosphatase
MADKKTVQTILSPKLFDNVTALEQKLVVVIDVLRATTTIATILNNGASCVIPALTIDSASEYKTNGYLVGGERNGEKVENFDFGNSPFDYLPELVNGKQIVLTTTNGTKCIEIGRKASLLITAAFVNFDAIVQYIQQQQLDIVLFAAGWKDKVNLEDSLLAGAICQSLEQNFKLDDASELAMTAYQNVQDNLYQAISKGNHFHRLKNKNITKDLEYCCQMSILNVVPRLEGKCLVE